MMPAEIAPVSALRSLCRFRHYGRPYARSLSIGVVLRIAELLADLAQPWPLAVIVDTVLGVRPLRGMFAPFLLPFAGTRLSLLSAAVIASIFVAAFSSIFDYLGDRIMNGAGERITADIRSSLFSHLQRLPLAFHDRRSIGEIVSRVSVDTSRIEDALVDVFSILLPGLLSIVGLLIVMLVVSWELGLVALMSVPVVFVTVHRYSLATRRASRTMREREGRLAAYTAEILAGIRTVHALGRHELHDKHFVTRNRRALDAGLVAVELRARFTPLLEMCTAFGTGALLWVGAWGVLRGLWTLGTLLVILTYVRNLLKPIRSLSKLSLTLSRGAASAERVSEVLDEPHLSERNAVPAEDLPPRARGHLALSHVCFAYGRGPVLKDANLQIEPGERLALVGANGSGKSSIMALLARLYDPQSGSVLLDGRPLDTVPIAWLRRQIAVVLQDTFLFSGTLWENLAYANPEATPDEVKAAAENALVSEFVEDLPDGYQTILGDRGIGLSGGQRQRVAIARALLLDAPIVLLDEPTSGLDLGAERTVVGALHRLMEGRTVIMATHRPALLALAERTISVESGALVRAERPGKLEVVLSQRSFTRLPSIR